MITLVWPAFIVLIVRINASLEVKESAKMMVEAQMGNLIDQLAEENHGNNTSDSAESDFETIGFSNDKQLDPGTAKERVGLGDFTKLAESQFTAKQRNKLVELHNDARKRVSPQASDMQLMEWHDEVAKLAQTWANKCEMKHGNPPGSPLSGNLGQNLYKGSDSDGTKAIIMWHDERKHYNIKTLKCTKVCGHYTQMVWATSRYLGCGIKRGCKKNENLIVCNYSPAGNVQGKAPYSVGLPCTKCAVGGACFKNSCVSLEDCMTIPGCSKASSFRPPAIISHWISMIVLKICLHF